MCLILLLGSHDVSQWNNKYSILILCPVHSPTLLWELNEKKYLKFPKQHKEIGKSHQPGHTYTSKLDKSMSSPLLNFCKPLPMLFFFSLSLVTKYSTHTTFLINFLLLRCAPVGQWISSAAMPYSSFVDMTLRT